MNDIKTYNTLFLDRDGVINKQRKGDYVKLWSEFVFIDGALEALALLSSLFKYIIVITNQRGVGKGVMSEEALEDIHSQMTETIRANKGRIDSIYYCTATDETDINRKPNTGMALLARQDFPKVDFGRSFFAGDSLSDIQFANNAGIPAILIGEKYDEGTISRLEIRAHYPDLLTFAQELKKKDSI